MKQIIKMLKLIFKRRRKSKEKDLKSYLISTHISNTTKY